MFERNKRIDCSAFQAHSLKSRLTVAILLLSVMTVVLSVGLFAGYREEVIYSIESYSGELDHICM